MSSEPSNPLLSYWPETGPEFQYWTVLCVVVGIIFVNEALLYSEFITWALLGYLLLFVGCTLALLVIEPATDLLRAFTLIPLFRLLNFGLPVFSETVLVWLVSVYGPMLVAAYILSTDLAAVELPTLNDLEIALLLLPSVILIGGLLATIEYLIVQPSALITSFRWVELIPFSVVMLVFVGFTEEFIFRGILQRILTVDAGRGVGIAVSSLVFGILHTSYQVPGEIGFGVAVGLVFAIIYDRMENLIVIALLHGTLNIALYGVLPLLEPLPFPFP